MKVLEDLADLAGHTRRTVIYEGLRPDVSRLHHSAASLLVADAKATEAPDGSMTQARLLRYALATREWVDAGFQVAFGVCHTPDQAGEWLKSLRTLMQIVGHPVVRSTNAILDTDTAVTLLTVGGGLSQRQVQRMKREGV